MDNNLGIERCTLCTLDLDMKVGTAQMQRPYR